MTHPKAMKNPCTPTSSSDRASDFLQTALSDLLRAVSCHSLRLIARSSSDRVLTFFGHLEVSTDLCLGTVANPIAMMTQEYDAAGAIITEILDLSQNFATLEDTHCY